MPAVACLIGTLLHLTFSDSTHDNTNTVDNKNSVTVLSDGDYGSDVAPHEELMK